MGYESIFYYTCFLDEYYCVQRFLINVRMKKAPNQVHNLDYTVSRIVRHRTHLVQYRTVNVSERAVRGTVLNYTVSKRTGTVTNASQNSGI